MLTVCGRTIRLRCLTNVDPIYKNINQIYFFPNLNRPKQLQLQYFYPNNFKHTIFLTETLIEKSALLRVSIYELQLKIYELNKEIYLMHN